MTSENDIPFTLLFTSSDQEEGRVISKTLVEEKLAACCNIIPNVTSIYRWKDEVHEEGEVLVLVKSRKELAKSLINRIEALHSYEDPVIEIIQIDAWTKYVENWIKKSTS